MYVAFNGTLAARRLEWLDFAQLAAKTGFPGTDVITDGAMKDGVAATQELLKRLNLKPAVVGLPVEFRKDDETYKAGMENLAAAAQFASAIGCPRMTTWILPSSELPKAEQRALYLKRFRPIAEILARSEVRFGLEYVSPVHLRKRFPYEFIWRHDEMLEFAHQCGPKVGILLDSWHWHHAGGTVKDILATGKDRIVHVQVADAPNLPPEKIMDNERLMPGEGVVDLTGFFQALKKLGYSDGVSPEIFGRGLKDIPAEEGARLGLRTTTAVMKKAGVL